MSTPSKHPMAVFRWVDPFTGDAARRDWPLMSMDGPGVVRAMGEIDTHEAGLEPGEGAGYDLIALHHEHGGCAGAAFILRTCGLAGGVNEQLLVAGRVDWMEV